MLEGLLRALKDLVGPCHITINTPALLGFNTPMSVNIDLISEIKSIAKHNKLVYKEKCITNKSLQTKCRLILNP